MADMVCHLPEATDFDQLQFPGSILSFCLLAQHAQAIPSFAGQFGGVSCVGDRALPHSNENGAPINNRRQGASFALSRVRGSQWRTDNLHDRSATGRSADYSDGRERHSLALAGPSASDQNCAA
jgi:hypothetical protein